MFLAELADETTGVLAFYQDNTIIFQITVVAFQPIIVVMFRSKNITFGGLSIGAWNKINVGLKYKVTSGVLSLTAILEDVIIGDVDFVDGVLPFSKANVYVSQPGLPPMHGQIRDLEFSEFLIYILYHLV